MRGDPRNLRLTAAAALGIVALFAAVTLATSDSPTLARVGVKETAPGTALGKSPTTAWDESTDVAGTPNFIVILVDGLGYRDVSFNGATQIQTPNLDRLASEGLVFSNGYVASPASRPRRS